MGRVFLTGATGFVGGALLARLVGRGDEVVALARSPVAADAIARRGGVPARGDAVDEDALAAGMARCAVAYHVAGVNTLCSSDPGELLRVNVVGAEAAVRAAARAGVRRVVLTSSASALGELPETLGHERTVHRGSYLSVYERSKHQGELAAGAAARRTGVELVTVNPSSVQGPGRCTGTAKMLIALLDGRLSAFLDTRISIIDLEDCVEGHLLAAQRGRAGERYVLSPPPATTRRVLELVSELSQVPEDVRMVPAPLARAAAGAVEAVYRARRRRPPVCRQMVRSILHGHQYDGSRAVRELGLTYTPLAETLRRTAEWAAAEGIVTRPLPGLAPGGRAAAHAMRGGSDVSTSFGR